MTAAVLATLTVTGPASAAAAIPCMDVQTVGGVTVSAIVYRDTWSKPTTCKPGYCGALVGILTTSAWRANRPPSRLPLCSRQVVGDVGPPPVHEV